MTAFSGLEILRDDNFHQVAGRRLGLLTNPSAVDSQLNSAYHLLTSSPVVDMRALFGPEHGFAGAAPEGVDVVADTDHRTGLPVHSLYGETYRPTPDMLDGVDAIICDIQDIGVRYYTYTWTVTHVLEAAGATGVGVIILDRPNPWGRTTEGPRLEPAQSSLVGRFAVPVRHGMTLGELARMSNALWNPTPAHLEVIPCGQWQSTKSWEATGLPWVPPSPNMPHLSTLRHYPGACLVEGTNLSEGRGTALPFEVIGAPWLDGMALAEHLNAQAWLGAYGARLRPHAFRPTSSKFAGLDVNGVQVYMTDAQRWQPLLAWLGVIMTIRTLYPEQFEWLADHFDRLIGSAHIREKIDDAADSDESIPDLLAAWQAKWQDDTRAFEQQRRDYLIYT